MNLSVTLGNGAPTTVTINMQAYNVLNSIIALLNGFDVNGNVPGQTLFRAAEQLQATIILEKEGKTKTEGTKVQLSLADTLYDTNKVLKDDGLKEAAESCLFELTNAINKPKFQLIDTQVSNAQLGLIPYGRAKCDLETDSTWNVAQIVQAAIQGVPPYQPSLWAIKQIRATKVYGQPNDRDTDMTPWIRNDKDKNAFQTDFAAAPHEQGAMNYMGLPTAQMYSYETILKLSGFGGVHQFLHKIVQGKCGLTYSNSTNSSGKIATWVAGKQKKYTGLGQSNHVRWYHTMIDFFHWLSTNQQAPKFTVTWTKPPYTDWAFTQDMKAKAPADDGLLDFLKNNVTAIKGFQGTYGTGI